MRRALYIISTRLEAAVDLLGRRLLVLHISHPLCSSLDCLSSEVVLRWQEVLVAWQVQSLGEERQRSPT